MVAKSVGIHVSCFLGVFVKGQGGAGGEVVCNAVSCHCEWIWFVLSSRLFLARKKRKGRVGVRKMITSSEVTIMAVSQTCR